MDLYFAHRSGEKENEMNHLIHWIEIPTKDLDKARSFYEKVLQVDLEVLPLGPVKYALFPTEDRYNTGALVQGEGYEPSPQGTIVYLDGSGGIDQMLGRVVQAGGRILLSKTFLSPEAGFIGYFLDTDGNKIGLQSME